MSPYVVKSLRSAGVSKHGGELCVYVCMCLSSCGAAKRGGKGWGPAGDLSIHIKSRASSSNAIVSNVHYHRKIQNKLCLIHSPVIVIVDETHIRVGILYRLLAQPVWLLYSDDLASLFAAGDLHLAIDHYLAAGVVRVRPVCECVSV